MNTDARIRPARRISAALVALVAAGALLGTVGCTTEAANQAKKVVGEEPSATAPNLTETIDPIDEEQTPVVDPNSGSDDAEDDDAGTNDAGDDTPADDTKSDDSQEADTKTDDAKSADKPDKVKTGSGHEDSGEERIHLQIVSVENTLKLRGKTYTDSTHNPRADECVTTDLFNPKSLGYPKWADTVKQGEVTHSCLQSSNDPSLELTYTIPGTTDLMWIYVKVPFVGNNILQCSVIDGGTLKTKVDSAYTCSSQWMQDGGHGKNPMPKVKLQKKPTVTLTDGAEAQQILQKYCAKGQLACDFSATKRTVEPSPKSAWKVLNTYNNCGPDKKKSALHEWGHPTKFEWENSIGISGSAEFELPGKFSVGGDLEFEGAWSFSNTYETEVHQPVPWGYADVFYLQVNYLQVTGDINIATTDKNYEIKKVTYKLPLAQSWTDDRGQTIPMSAKYAIGKKITCPAKAFVGSTGKKMLDGSRTPTADKL